MELYPLEQVTDMLRKKRQRLGVKQKKAADLAGLSNSQVNRMEKNSVNPSYEAVFSLYEALETLEDEKAETARDLMNRQVCWIDTDQTLEEAARKMRENDFSQLPVREKGVSVGRITERKIIEAGDPDARIGEFMGPELMGVREGTRAEVVEEILKQEPAVLVKAGSEFSGIVTKADLL